MLTIYNSLTRQKEKFQPIEPGQVRMYVCGITVYDYCHIGHARMILVFDMIVRYLRHRGYRVNYVRNITDIDDKIINRARDNGEPFEQLTARFIQAMNEDFSALNVLAPDHEPRATDHIEQIIAMIARLFENGYAYRAENGDVFYDVSEFADYGKLSGKHIDELRVGIRVDVQEAKTDPVDFVLWKAAKPDEPAWDSPWGRGRPGWHIECSAMSTHCLGADFDIHGGGQDLCFPHHENEIAQSRGAGSRTFANLWIHNGFVRVDDEKMSKSLGNFFTIREVMARYLPEVIRFFILSSHYRSPLNYSDSHLDEARAGLTRLYTSLRDIDPGAGEPDGDYQARFEQAMDDDFNSRAAITVLHELAGEINRLADKSSARAADLARTLLQLGDILGILQLTPAEFLRAGPGADGISDAAITRLIAQRTQAKAARDYATADRLREQLAEHDIILEDGPGGTTWRRGNL
ncbi:MAG: cysteine--tRNA ligase [Gammaproteobacteria bacterium]|nr:cysteine--tRNA ligase [Gammaproteobacteria bacterium]MCY4339308.1 cysteine--tRNA ligase [Gammaproteobacteria bacterium]